MSTSIDTKLAIVHSTTFIWATSHAWITFGSLDGWVFDKFHLSECFTSINGPFFDTSFAVWHQNKFNMTQTICWRNLTWLLRQINMDIIYPVVWNDDFVWVLHWLEIQSEWIPKFPLHFFPFNDAHTRIFVFSSTELPFWMNHRPVLTQNLDVSYGIFCSICVKITPFSSPLITWKRLKRWLIR